MPEDVTASAARPDVLGYPSPTTARYLIFTVALVASGLFVGNWVHNQGPWGDNWTSTVAACEQRWGGGRTVTEMLDRNRGFTRCTAGVERTRVLVTASGALVVGGTAVAMLWVVPGVVVRRRRLRPLPAGLAAAGDRFAGLAAAAGVTGRVAPLLGPAGQRDAFSFGAPGRYRVALPPAAAVRYADRSTFDPLVHHELAHVLHRDVALAWLTRLVWWALIPVLAVPVVISLVSGDLSVVGAYLCRVGLLAVVVALLSGDLLRTREYGADLRAVRLQGALAPVVGLVRRARSPQARTLRQRVLANHPTVEDRLSVLADPASLTGTGFRDGLAGGFLTAMTVPLLVAAVTPLLAPIDAANTAYLLAAVLLGPMLAGSVGLGLWRAALFARLSGRSAPALEPALGVGLGLLLGQAVSLDTAGTGGLTGVSQPAWLLVSGVAGAGAVLVAAGLGHLWADAAVRLPGVRVAWPLALVLCSLVFCSLLWSTTQFQNTVDAGGWALGRLAVSTALAPWPMWVLVLVLAASALTALLLGRRGVVRAPGWLVEEPDPPAWPPEPAARAREALGLGAVAGLAGAAAVVGFRLLAGAATSDAATWERYQAYQWVAGLTAAASMLAGLARRPARGAGLGLLSGPLAAVVVLIGFLVLNSVLGGRPEAALIAEFVRPAVVLGFYLSLLLAPLVAGLAWLAGRRRSGQDDVGVRSVGLALTGACVLALVLGAGGLAARGALVERDPTVRALEETGVGELGATELLGVEFARYLGEVVPTVTGEYRAAADAAAAIWSDPNLSPATRAARTRTEVLPSLTDLLDRMAAYPTGADAVTRMHSELVSALRDAIERYRLLADSGGVLDEPTTARLRALAESEAGHWGAWAAQRNELAAQILGG